MLRSISELRTIGDVELHEYAASQEIFDGRGFYTRNFVTNHVVGMVYELRGTPASAVPLTRDMMILLFRFINSNYYNDDEAVIDHESIRVPFSAEPIKVFQWTYDGNTHRVFVTEEQLFEIEEFMNLMENDADETQVGSFYTAHFNNPDPYPETNFSDEEMEYLTTLGIMANLSELLSENSGSIEVKENTARFSGAMWYNAIQEKVVTLAGVGGIGSYVGFLLARMNPKAVYIYDDDRVEAVNMSGQFYGKSDIGNYKVDALARAVRNYADYNSVFSVNQRFTMESSASDIMICGFDNMSARKLFFNKWMAHVINKPVEERRHCLFIDGRLAAEDLQVICITGDNAPALKKYSEEFLFSDEEADETVCSYKQTTYMANMIGSIMVNLFTNFVANELVNAPIRSLPFFTAYDGISMRIKNE